MIEHHSFARTIRQLREQETVVLYEKWIDVSAEEQEAVSVFLAEEHQTEALNYPFQAPVFDAPAGVWAALTVYRACQLLLHRSLDRSQLPGQLPPFEEPLTPSVLLSADLTLRFLPDVITRLQLIDPDDALIPILHGHLQAFHYSGVRLPLAVDELDFSPITANPCLHQLYADRVVAHKNQTLAKHPALREKIRANLGMFAATFWAELDLSND